MEKEKKITKVIRKKDRYIDEDFRTKNKNKLNLSESKKIIENLIKSEKNLKKKIKFFQEKKNSKIICEICGYKKWIYCLKCEKLLISSKNLPFYNFKYLLNM